MKGRLIALALLALAAMDWTPVSAQGNEPVVYVFWGQSCPHSQRAMTFIRKLRKEDPRLQVRDYEVEGNPENAAAHERFLERIGITGVNLVPVSIVGENVLIGFESDEVSGTKIRDYVDQCRSFGCPDRFSDLVPGATPEWTTTTLAPRATTCASQSRALRVDARAR